MRIAIAMMLALAAVGCGDDTTSGVDMAATGDMAVPDLATGATVARGEELVKHLLLCGSCHTTPDASGNPSTDPTAFLAGGRKFTVTLPGVDGGTFDVYAPNITPDNATGVGMWTNGLVADAVTVGVDVDGLPLWPTMPYPRFASLTPDDAASIALYIKSLPPQSHTVPEDTGHPTLASPALDYTPIPHTTLAASDPGYAAAERGRYLANLGCVTCHTPTGAPPLGLDVTKAYGGGRSFGGGLKSANLTPDATGLAGWTIADIVSTLKTNQEKGTGVMLLAPMAGGPDGFGGLFDNDLTDLAQYIHTLPPVVNGPFMHPDM